jgi:LytS/YehU family sensor histidine kinase
MKGWGMENFINRIGPGAIISLSVGLFVCCIVFFYTTWRQAIEREQKLREENLKYRYRTLKTQVNPHFLFNSLNTLSEIVYADARKADSYIQKLSGIYRYILDNEETDLISLDKEIEFVRQYFALQKERDENKIQLDSCVENADKFKIIPISLQILVENALKHNVISEETPLKIHINGDNGFISISNNIQRKSILNNSSGTGLSNLKERVKLITGKEVIINQENNQFTVKLPLIDI